MTSARSRGSVPGENSERTPVHDRVRVVDAYVRSNARAGWQRVRGAVVPNTHAAFFATISWLICHDLLGAPSPVFAPTATYLCLGFTRNREPRKVLEVGVGATIGVFIGEVSSYAFGFGWWQVLLLVLVAPLIARFLDGADLLTFQTTTNALMVGSMIQVASGIGARELSFGRWTDAVIGAAVALVASLVLPRSVTSRPRRYTATALTGIADALHATAEGLEDGDVGQTKVAYAELDVAAQQITAGVAARRSAADIVLLKPARQSDRADLAELKRLLRLSDRLHGSVFMLTRQTAGMIGEAGPNPVVAELTEESSRTLRGLATQIGRWEKPDEARDAALALSARLSPEAIDETDWRSNALVALLRSVSVDLLQLTGLSVPQARAALPDTGDLDVRSDEADALPEEGDSDLWGTMTFPTVEDEEGQPGSAQDPGDQPERPT